MTEAVSDSWRSISLKDIAEVRSSSVDKKTVEGEPSVRLCNYMDVYANRQITNSMDLMPATAPEAQIDKFLLLKDDVIITKDSETPEDIAIPAHVAEPLENVVCGYHLTLIRPNKQQLSGHFLSYLLSLDSVRHRYFLLANGSTRFGLGLDAIRDTQLAIPELKEQERIAEILGSADDVIEQTRTQIAKLEDLKTATMNELLTKGIGHTEFKDTELGPIPESWVVCKVSEISERVDVGIVSKPADHYVPEGVPALRSTNVRLGGVDLTDCKFISAESNELFAKSQIRAGDVLTVRTGVPGVSAVVPRLLDGANCIDILVATPKSHVRSGFLCEWINSARGKAQVLDKQAGLAQQHFNLGDLRDLLISLPPISEQDQIVAATGALERQIETRNISLLSSEALKKSLMQDLLTGKVRVSV